MLKTKVCSRCKIVKPISEFYKNRSNPNGFHCECKQCYKIYEQSEKGIENKRQRSKRYYKSEKGKAYNRLAARIQEKRYPEKKYARNVIKYAIQARTIPTANQLSCRLCDLHKAAQYHHPDYSLPLYVVPLCRICHRLIHKR